MITPLTTIAPGGEQPGDGRRHAPPSRAGRPSPPRMTSVRFAPGPSGTAWRRTSSGSSTTRTSGSSRCSLERAPGSLEEERVADGEHASRPASSSPLRCTATTTRSPLSVTIPGNTVSPTSCDRGGSRPPPGPSARVRSCVAVGEPVLLDQRARVVARSPSRSSVRPGCGSSRSPKRTTIAWSRPRAGCPASGEREVAEAAGAGVVRVLGGDDVHGRAGEREQRAGMGARRRAAAAAAMAAAAAAPP